jgi:hypothetical protein
MNDKSRMVIPRADGTWEVRAPGADRASGVFDTQRDAIDRGREIVRNLGGGELQIRGTNGQIRASDTVPHGHDPFPPKG